MTAPTAEACAEGTQGAPWAAFYPGSLASGFSVRFRSVLDAWEHQVSERPDGAAVHFFDATLSVRQVDDAVNALGRGLLARGVQPGDRIALYLQNDPQFLVGLLAAWKLGAVPVAVSPMLLGKELAHQLNDCGATVLLCLDSLYAEVAADVVPSTRVTTVITTHPLDLTPLLVLRDGAAAAIPSKRRFPDALDWCEVVEQHQGRHLWSLPPKPGGVAVLTYTSGTTGPAKAALNLHSGVVHNAQVYADWWDLQSGRDVVLGTAPVFHITGIVAALAVSVVAGVPLVLLHRFDADETLRAIEQHRVTFTVAASTAFTALSRHPSLTDYDTSSLTKTPSGGAPVSPALVERVRQAAGWTLRGAYGLTETTSPTHLGPGHVDPPLDPATGALSVGVPVPGCRVRIVDPVHGGDLQAGQVGEIVVSGPMVVPGYWQRDEESALAVRDGWLHTGDLGKQDEQGWLFVVDRLKDMINAAGYKVVPRDVEDVLLQHRAVREAVVVGVPDDYRGETVKAFVSLQPGASVSATELIEFCKARMAAYKYPRAVDVLPELPKNAAGKFLRRELRETHRRPEQQPG